MTTKTKQKLFIASLNRRFPRRVLQSICSDYNSFQIVFDLPRKRHLKVKLTAFAKENGTVEMYEQVHGTEPGRFWLLDSSQYTFDETDPLPLLTKWLKRAIGTEANGYEGSFAEVLLAAFREDKAKEKTKV